MVCPKKALVILMTALVGIWGCAQSPGPGSATSSDRIKALEVKNAKLEDDFRTAAAARDQLRRKVAAAEEEQRQLRAQVDEQITVLTRERDLLRHQLAERTAERDTQAQQYEAFRKNLRDLIGHAEAAISKPADVPVTATVELDAPEKL